MKNHLSPFTNIGTSNVEDSFPGFVAKYTPTRLYRDKTVKEGVRNQREALEEDRANRRVRTRKIVKKNTSIMVEYLTSLNPSDWDNYVKYAEVLFNLLQQEVKKEDWKFINSFMKRATHKDTNEYAMLFLLDALYEYKRHLDFWHILYQSYQNVSLEPFSFEGR